MSKTIDQLLMRTFERLSPTTSAGETFVRLGGGTRGGNRYGVIVDPQGQPLSCVSTVTVQSWPRDLPLHALEARWPPLLALDEAEAITAVAVARFFSDDLFDRDDIPAVVLTDPDGRPSALLLRRDLVDALSAQESVTRNYPTGAKEPAPISSERDLMVTRWGRLQFPAQVALARPVQLAVSIQRQPDPDTQGQVELGLTARQWPVYVIATVLVAEEDFRIVGPPVQVIEVPSAADSAAYTFTLMPLQPGEKTVRVKFEQNNTYLGTAKVLAEVTEAAPLDAGQAPVIHAPRLGAILEPPDVTLYVDRVGEGTLTYAMRARLASDDPTDGNATREIGRFEFPREPTEYIDALFVDLNAKARQKLTAAEFDDMVRKIGGSLFDMLSRGNDLRTFYWQHMHDQAVTVQIVSQEPYIPWEIVRPNHRLPDGRWESAPYLCQTFALARWLVDGGSPADRAPLRRMTLVLPPSNLKYAQQEAEALQRLPGLAVEMITDKPALEQFLRDGQTHVLHFACHGDFESDLPERSAVWLGASAWQPMELTAEYRNFGRSHPLVFLNACDTGRIGFGLTGLEGWAREFLASDAGIFLGATWKIDDKLAAEFAHVFYQQIIQGAPVGEAVRRAREHVRTPGDATWLSYTLYANPKVRAIVEQPPL